MKLVGAVAVLLAALFGSGKYVMSEKQHIKVLSSMIQTLGFMRSEIDSKHTPLPEILFRLSENRNDESACFYRELFSSLDKLGSVEMCRLWENSCRKNLFSLNEEETEMLISLGNVLGRYSAAEQCTLISRTIDNLEQKKETRQENYALCKRLSVGISFSCAAMIVIILI